MKRYFVLGSFVGLLLVSGAFVLQETILNSSAREGATIHSFGNVPTDSKPVTLYSVAHAEHVIHANISLPDATPLGPGFRIVGAQIDRQPINESIGNGATFRFWSVNLYITNQPFVNGSTLSTGLFPQAVIVNETPAWPNSSSSEQAQSFADPGQACVVSLGAHTSSSCTQNQGPSSHVIQIRNTYLAVTPSVPNAVFQIDEKGLIIAIYPGTPNAENTTTSAKLSLQQVVAIAGRMIP